MLKITVVIESFDDEKQKFIRKTIDLELEHSLVSLSKWESKFEIPFLSDKEKTNEQAVEYIRCMILTSDYPSDILKHISSENVDEINEYIGAKMTATWFTETPGMPVRSNTEKITNELIYYWMTSYQIPWEAENWHLNRLFTLIRVFNAKNEKPKKLTASQVADQRRKLNAQRKAELNTTG